MQIPISKAQLVEIICPILAADDIDDDDLRL